MPPLSLHFSSGAGAESQGAGRRHWPRSWVKEGDLAVGALFTCYLALKLGYELGVLRVRDPLCYPLTSLIFNPLSPHVKDFLNWDPFCDPHVLILKKQNKTHHSKALL